MTAKPIFDQLRHQLEGFYPGGEATALSFLLLESFYGLSRSEVIADKPVLKEAPQELEQAVTRLQNHEPVQYILGQSHFYGLVFKVNSSVLIPRPETEELVQLIISDARTIRPLRLLDIGTGSGCIPVTLATHLPATEIHALDISQLALSVARENAAIHRVQIHFHQKDVLHQSLSNLPRFDIIVSNPPYVTHTEKKLMQRNVLDFEPALALFVSDLDPLIFYRRIAGLAMSQLHAGGRLYFEINEQFGQEMQELLMESGYAEAEVFKDINGKDRIVRARVK